MAISDIYLIVFERIGGGVTNLITIYNVSTFYFKQMSNLE